MSAGGNATPFTSASSRRYHSAARRRPALRSSSTLQLLAADRRLNLVEAEIEPDLFVEIFVLAPVVAKHGHLAGDFLVAVAIAPPSP